ncbi:SERTA domain-containing protein 3 [Pleurotus ostreatus]|nr:SERTA domain-containing protein 3 [Pleurotus ostreatus]
MRWKKLCVAWSSGFDFPSRFEALENRATDAQIFEFNFLYSPRFSLCRQPRQQATQPRETTKDKDGTKEKEGTKDKDGTNPTTAQEPDLLKPFTCNWAQGARLAFLQQSLQVYNKAALKSSQKAQDSLDGIINDYFKQFNWRHPISREPKPDDPPLDDPKAKLPASEEKLKQQVIAKMKDSIGGWMRYRANKVDHGLKQITNTSPNNPYAILLSQLSGIGLKPPKRLCAWQMLLKHGFEPHAKDFQRSFAASGEPQSEMANRRNEYDQAIFDKLGPSDKEAWAQRAKDAHEAQRAEIEGRAQRILAFTPEERQEAIERLGDFFYPIMEGVSEITRCHVTVLVGGPEPAQGGQINVLSLHVGENLSAIPKTWSEGDKPGHDICVQAYQRWLETCFTPEDQLAAAIPGTRAAALPSSRTQHSTNLRKRKENDRDPSPDPSRSDSHSIHRSSSKHQRRHARDVSSDSSDSGDTDSDTDSDLPMSKRRAKKRKERRQEKKKACKAKSKRDREALSSDEDEPNAHRS